MDTTWELLREWQNRSMVQAGELGTAAFVMQKVLTGQITDHEQHIARAWLNRYEARNAADAAELAAAMAGDQ